MYGVNVGLEIGKRALLSQQLLLNLTGHNIANVNTPGFTRQQAIVRSTDPYSSIKGNFGTGVEIVSIIRLRTLFLDEQYREESQSLGRWQTLSQGWGQIEMIYAEPSDSGLSSIMDNFWNAWQDLSVNPESMAARAAVKEQGNIVTNAFNHMAEQLTEFQQSLDEDIQKTVQLINNIGYQIAALNDSIETAELSGHKANDLRDRRDYLIDELSQLVNVNTLEQPSGNYTVFLGSMMLVDGGDVQELETVIRDQGSAIIHDVEFVNSTAAPDISNGKLAGLIETRDEIIMGRLQELDELALGLVEKINEVHRQGYNLYNETGIDFFDKNTTGAADIKLDDMILSDEANIAASLNGEPGDNSNVLQIAGLRFELTMRNGSASFGDFYNSLIGIIGLRAREAENNSVNQESLVFHIENNRQSLEGVSLDEEMTNMIKYEHAYQAAARVITTMDAALDTIINRMGLVGR